MANRIFNDCQALEKGVIVLAGSFRPNGSSAPLALTGKGIASVSRSGTGVFLVTLEDVYLGFLSLNAQLALASTDDKTCQIGAVSLANKTIEVKVIDISGAAVADVAANAGNVIYLTFILKNTSV